jgi:HNH endonuclease
MTFQSETSGSQGQTIKRNRVGEVRALGRKELTYERASALLDYDPDSGIFRHKVTRGGCKAGEVAGTVGSGGYTMLFVDYFPHKGARIAWLLMSRNPVPKGKVIDHINGDRADDRLENLRPATRAENARNRSPKNGRKVCGVYGVGKMWTAEIMANGEKYRLGRFTCETAAIAARCKAAKHYFGDFARRVSEGSANG